MKIEADLIDNTGVASRGAWDMPYSGTFNPNSSPMPFNYPGEPPRYLFDKDESGSGNFCKYPKYFCCNQIDWICFFILYFKKYLK